MPQHRSAVCDRPAAVVSDDLGSKANAKRAGRRERPKICQPLFEAGASGEIADTCACTGTCEYVCACVSCRPRMISASLSAALVSVHNDHTNALKTPLHSHNQQTPCSPRTCTRTQTCPTSIHPQSRLERTDRTPLAGRSERRGACAVRFWRSKSVA